MALLSRLPVRQECPTTFRLSPVPVTIPDAEFGTEQTVLGYLVYADYGKDIGELWHDAEMWCWRTEGGTYGRAPLQIDAIRALWEAGR